MIIYWSMFIIPALAAYFETERKAQRRSKQLTGYYMLICFMFVVIAFRETGGDWYTYHGLFELLRDRTLEDAMVLTDPAYGALNRLSSDLGLGLYGVNAACAAIFLVGFVAFCTREARPILMLAVAVPYLIIVVAVGYTRQGTAIGLEFLALLALMRRRVVWYLIWVAAAIAFHRSAAILLPLAYFAIPARSGWIGRLAAAATIGSATVLFYLESTAQVDRFVAGYVESDRYSSQGALVRSVMSATAAAAFLIYWQRWGERWADRDIWLTFAIVALALVPLTQVASTAADRIGLYVIPLQIVVFARLPMLYTSRADKRILVAATLAVYALALGVWLHLGQFAGELWLPYRSLLLGTIA